MMPDHVHEFQMIVVLFSFMSFDTSYSVKKFTKILTILCVWLFQLLARLIEIQQFSKLLVLDC